MMLQAESRCAEGRELLGLPRLPRAIPRAIPLWSFFDSTTCRSGARGDLVASSDGPSPTGEHLKDEKKLLILNNNEKRLLILNTNGIMGLLNGILQIKE